VTAALVLPLRLSRLRLPPPSKPRLIDYYRDRSSGHGRYSACYGQDSEILTSVLTRPDWLDLDCPLTAACDRLTLTSAADNDLSLDEQAAGAAAQRLAETLATGTRLVDMPLFRLLHIDVGEGAIAGSVAVTQFAHYALTMDLLEGELIDALTAGLSPHPGSLPLRDRYLPDLASVLGVADRLCAGGTLALCEIARPASPYRGPADYVLLIQERSADVVNAARRLAVIPKGFHQPMTDFRADARIGATLRRETEEELFGREDIDNTITKPYAADPMHPTRLSEPMRWLTEAPGRLRIECTGFGLNLVSGNFEFPCLIVIDAEDFWSRSADKSRRIGSPRPCVSTPAWIASRPPSWSTMQRGAAKDCSPCCKECGVLNRSAETA
jgi:hypothetical protein